MNISDWIIWEPSPSRDAFWAWWNGGFFGINNQMLYGPPVDYPGDWLAGSIATFALILGPCLMLEQFERWKNSKENLLTSDTETDKTQEINMPKKLHDKLAREARKKGLKGERADAYVYGTMNKIEKKKRGK